jgi:glutathionylspermidine synthase
MQRLAISPRADLEARAREAGFDFHRIDGATYWDESAYYAFSLRQIEDHLEDPTTELAAMCLELARRIVTDDRLLARLRIPEHAWPLIRDSWNQGQPSLYGRFDFAYDGKGAAKLLEYNADTPTALFEAAVFQWGWLEDMIAAGKLPKRADQFNSIHETLIARFEEFARIGYIKKHLHLTCMMDSVEDRGFIAYLVDCAAQAGIAATVLSIEDIGSRNDGPFLDAANKPITTLFKLYPWEWMLDEAFGQAPAMRTTRFIEPPWKAVLSNKGMLPLLWEMAPGHPNLLPAFFDDDPKRDQLGGRFARKPFHSREGANITLVDGDNVLDRDTGPYGYGSFIRQALADLPAFAGNYPVIGSWVVGDKACGIGIREDHSMITKNTSRFIPHAILT